MYVEICLLHSIALVCTRVMGMLSAISCDRACIKGQPHLVLSQGLSLCLLAATVRDKRCA